MMNGKPYLDWMVFNLSSNSEITVRGYNSAHWAEAYDGKLWLEWYIVYL